MSRFHWQMLNAEAVDAVPACLLQPHRNADARLLSRSRWLLRRKRDGRYIAVIMQTDKPQSRYSQQQDRVNGLLQLCPLDGCTGADLAAITSLLALLDLAAIQPLHSRRPAGLRRIPRRLQSAQAAATPKALLGQLAELGIDPRTYALSTALPLTHEPMLLMHAGQDRYRRPLWLVPKAARAWPAMRCAAAAAQVRLEAISGFRSHAYQLGIFRRKRARGQSVAQILAVNAAPGFSEHHSGRALDIGTPGEPPAEESFETTAAFAWLAANAHRFGFHMSYPRDNPHGIVYEPWHWYWDGIR